MLNEIKEDMDDNTKLDIIFNTIANIETTLLQQRECFTGLHEPDLNDGEHADNDKILAEFCEWTKRGTYQMK